MRLLLVLIGISMLLSCSPTLNPSTRVVFNHAVDKRFAWLGNDAEVVNFQDEILSLINNATTSIEVSTMTFSKPEIANALVAKANAGVRVRIIGNGGHRLAQDGWKLGLKGKLEMVDNNLPALLYRINFQSDAVVPSNWIADRGELYGNHGGINYGWTSNQTANIQSANVFESPILDDYYVRANSDGVQTWEIEVSNGPYYVALVTGMPNAAIRTYLKVENTKILNSGAFDFATRNASEFWGEAVDGGTEAQPGEDPASNAVRIMVNDSKLTLTIGNSTAPAGTKSAINFIEIYRGDAQPNGDTSYDDGIDNTVQNRQTMHAKYIIIDAGLSTQRLWVSSGNLTQGMDAASNNSEDAIISKDANLISSFSNMFNQMWGSDNINPIPTSSNFGTYKNNTSSDLNIDAFPWLVRFSPSVSTTDMAEVVQNHINTSSKDMILIMEQFNNSGGSRGFTGTNSIISTINSKLSNSYKLRGVIGSDLGVNSATFPGTNDELAFPTATSMKIHNKYALLDALNDSRTTLRGKVLTGSMNWTQSGLHFNDEQTLIIQNPYIANQYLQHAMKRMAERGIHVNNKTDIVMVLDRSFSMNEPSSIADISKIEAAKQAANLFLDILDADNTHRLSMVRFGNAIESFAPAIALSDYSQAKRTEFHTGINSTLATLPIGSATCYNIALEESIHQLEAIPSPHPRRIIHFFTDGKENCLPNSNTFYSALQSKNIEVHSTGFGAGTDMATSLDGLSNATGGTYAQVELNPISLNKRFAEIARDAMNLNTVLDPTFQVKRNETIKSTFFLDKMSTKLKVILSWAGKFKKVYSDFYLISPEGKRIDKNSSNIEWNEDLGHIVISLSTKTDIKLPGVWNIVFTLSNEFPDAVLPIDLIVFADGALTFKSECINDTKNKKIILSRLLNFNEPVTNLKVIADIKSPVSKEYEIPKIERIILNDNGKFNDGKPNDGLFGGEVNFRVKGNYQIHVIAEGVLEGQPLRRESIIYYTVK